MRTHALVGRGDRRSRIYLSLVLGIVLSALPLSLTTDTTLRALASGSNLARRGSGSDLVQLEEHSGGHYAVGGAQLFAHNGSPVALATRPRAEGAVDRGWRPERRPGAPDPDQVHAHVERPGFHPAPPRWLMARFDQTLAQVRRLHPDADTAAVTSFLHETYEHTIEI